MIEIRAIVEPYDNDNATGVSLSFTVKDERKRHARLIDKPLDEVRLVDAIQVVKDIAQEMLARA